MGNSNLFNWYRLIWIYVKVVHLWFDIKIHFFIFSVFNVSTRWQYKVASCKTEQPNGSDKRLLLDLNKIGQSLR